MPSSIATTLLVLGAILVAAGGWGVGAGIAVGIAAVVFEVALFVYAAVASDPDPLAE